MEVTQELEEEEDGVTQELEWASFIRTLRQVLSILVSGDCYSNEFFNATLRVDEP